MITPRDYQQDAVDSIFDYFEDNTGNPILVLPTGAGKSIIIALLIIIIKRKWPFVRILMLTHVKELIEQNHEKLMTVWPEAPAGIYSAGLKRKDKDQSVIFAGIQSIHKKAFDFEKFDLVLIDECHLVPSKTAGTYRKFLGDLKLMNPALKVIGTTATPYRLDNGMLTHGDDRIFTDICFDLPVKKLLKDGYLSPVRTRQPNEIINLSGVKTRGDYVVSDQAAAMGDKFTESAINDILSEGAIRRSWLIFCPTVSYAETITDRLRDEGVNVEMVTGETPKTEREQILKNYKAGLVKALVNVDVLTTGFDAPQIDLLVLLRATKSTALYVQIIGRGMRITEGKKDCLVLDFGGNVERHGPIDCVTPPGNKKKSDKKGVAPTKKCPKCNEILSAFVSECTACGYEFPAKPLHESEATTAAILSEDIKPEWLNVDAVHYSLHAKEGKRPSLKVSYRCGLKYFNEWVCLEHMGYAQAKAAQWWCARSDSMPPVNIANALDYINQVGIDEPKQICTKKTGKYLEIVDYSFMGEAVAS